MRIVAGVDCHKSSHTIAFIDENGSIHSSISIPTTIAGYQKALDIASSYGCKEWGIEGSGLYGYAFAMFVSSTGSIVYDIPGALTKARRRKSTSRAKSDLIDARAIAQCVISEHGRIAQFFAARVQRALRMRYDQRDRYVRERTVVINRLRSAALLMGVASLPTNLTPMKVIRNLREQVASFRLGLPTDAASEAILDDIEDSAQTVADLNERIKRSEKIIQSLLKENAKELLAVRGISHVAAAGIIGHAGDLRNIRNASAFAMKCGVAPVQCSSGKRESVRVNLGGNRQLNRILHTTAMSQVRCTGHPGRIYYDKKRAEGKTHLSAMRCLKRSLATVIFYRLQQINDDLFDGERFEIAQN